MVKRWKIAFYSVFIVFFAFIMTLAGLFYVYLSPVDESELKLDEQQDTGQPMFTVSSSKQQLTRLINQQLQGYEQKKNLHLRVDLQNEIILDGALSIFGSDIAFEMRFKPVAQENGDLILKEESFQLGKVLLPQDKVLEFIKKGTSLPDWVQVLPDKERIYIALTEIKLEDQFYLKAKDINLGKNIIQFSVYKIAEEETS